MSKQHKTFEYTVEGDEMQMVHHTSSSRWAEELDEQPETAWVTMPDGTQRIPSQVNDPCLNSLSEMSAAYAEQQRQWSSMSIDERRAWMAARPAPRLLNSDNFIPECPCRPEETTWYEC